MATGGGQLNCLVGCVFAALCALATLAHAQAPAKPAAEDPKFEIRRFVFDGATLLPAQQLVEATRPFTGSARNFGDVQRAPKWSSAPIRRPATAPCR